MVPCLMTLTDL